MTAKVTRAEQSMGRLAATRNLFELRPMRGRQRGSPSNQCLLSQCRLDGLEEKTRIVRCLASKMELS